MDKQNPVSLVYSINYAAFSFIEGNRETRDQLHIERIQEAMRRGDFIPPIIVDETTGTIVDGQHRYLAAIELWKRQIDYHLLVMYVDYSNPLLAAIKYNSTSKNWSTSDYVDAYVADNRESFKILKEFCQESSLLSSTIGNKTSYRYKAAVQILTQKSSSRCITDGTLKIEDIELARKIYNELAAMVKATNNIRIIARGNLLAWIQVRNYILFDYTLTEWCKVLSKKFQAPQSDTKSDWVNVYLNLK